MLSSFSSFVDIFQAALVMNKFLANYCILLVILRLSGNSLYWNFTEKNSFTNFSLFLVLKKVLALIKQQPRSNSCIHNPCCPVLQWTRQLSPVAPHIQGHLLNTLLCFTTFLTDKRRIWGQFVKPQAIIDHSLEDHSDINKAGARWVAKRTHFSSYYGNNYQGLHILLFTWSMANSYISFYFQSCRSHPGPNSTSSSPYCPLLSAADWCAPVTLSPVWRKCSCPDSGDIVTARRQLSAH